MASLRVSHRDDTAQQRDPLGREPIRVASTIPALMVAGHSIQGLGKQANSSGNSTGWWSKARAPETLASGAFDPQLVTPQ
jgi:hypothetical protein